MSDNDYSYGEGKQAPRWKDSRGSKALGAAGGALRSAGQDMLARSAAASESRIHDVQYRTGGKVRKTGSAGLHRGERVIPASKRKKVERLMKRSGMSLTNKKRGKSRGRR